MIGSVILKLRNMVNISQEGLALRLGVPVEQLQDWESGRTTPDNANLDKIAEAFHISRSDFYPQVADSDFPYRLISRYEVAGQCDYDIYFGEVESLQIMTHAQSHIKIVLVSEYHESNLEDYQITLHDTGTRIKVFIKTTKKPHILPALTITLPVIIRRRVELSGDAEWMNLYDLNVQRIEFDGTVSRIAVQRLSGHFEINCNKNISMTADKVNGQIDFNQLSSNSVLRIAEGDAFRITNKGFGNQITLVGATASKDSPNGVEINGTQSSLLIQVGR